MKITDSEIIKNGEQELIDAITADLDWGAIEDIFLKEHNLGIEEDIEYKSGDIIAVDNQIAYKLEFEVKVNLSVLLDRNGEYLSVTISNRKDSPEENKDIDIHSESPEPDEDADNQTAESTNTKDTKPAEEQNDVSSGNTDQIDSVVNDVFEDPGNNNSEDSATDPFGDLSDTSTDEMGQKVDDILENIKKVG
jgi:hypothetical protein